ncbi:ABC transporter substrate-binding protein [Nonomuraea aurantiaca]|uniref:ABC transporter substrate-binding protein n=1 Tax=Nonomuraea aurantiaca TaxID=2878562 RepID=UPI001CDA39B8|nr:ABC transporter substrate-binding protein [Nonomuraea aurantiaca]MCA2224589.1 ABC transporter substrate-binding protein [Nonomuraea aurantiaca]
MADLRSVVEALIRRPVFWRADPPLPTVLVTGPEALAAVELLAEPFQDSVPYAHVKEGAYGTVQELVKALAGEHGQLGKPVGGSLLPPPRFPLAQFVLWAREQRDLPPPDAAGSWPPDPHSHRGYRAFKERLKEWQRSSRDSDRGRRTSADFLARAATTWVPVGTLAVWWFNGPADLVGLAPWVLGLLVAALGTTGQAFFSIRGTLFTGWLRKQPYVRRKRFERPTPYALRLANADDDAIERLLVHALIRDLREAYKKWIIPWPSWGRGLYALLLIQVVDPDGVNARFLRLVEETTKKTGLLPPMVVLAAVSSVPPGPPIGSAELDELPEVVGRWRAAARLRVPDLRIGIRATEVPAVGSYPPVLPRRKRALAYWTAIGLLLVLPFALVLWMQRDRAAHCGGLQWAERSGTECVGIVNATADTPDDLFDGAVKQLVKKIDANNAYALGSGRYVSVVLFGEFSIMKTEANDTRLSAAVSELEAVEEQQRTASTTPRLQVLIANAGDNFRHGRRTAQLITELAAQDPHVMGVIGLPRSVEGVSQAIEELHLAKIPMVATTATADRIGYVGDSADGEQPGQPSPYYFQMGPTNFREATLGARFARRMLLADVDKPVAVIVQDESITDQYTKNLADDFETALTAQGITVKEPKDYNVESGGIQEAAVAACGLKPDVFLYAGRASEFLGFLASVEGSGCKDAKVLAGDDVVRAMAEHAGEIAHMKQMEVYYVALAHRAVWNQSATKQTAFISGLLAGAHAKSSDDNLILTFDAANVLYQAASTAYRAGAQEGGGLPSRGDILYRLTRRVWNGSSGKIDFGSADLHAPVDKAIAIMKVDVARAGNPKPVVRCGSLDVSEPPPKDTVCAHLPDTADYPMKAPQ